MVKLVVGVGNLLRSHDAFGICCAKQCASDLASLGWAVAFSDANPSAVLDSCQQAEKIVFIDAVQSDAHKFGTLILWDVVNETLPFSSVASSHGYGLAEGLELAKALGMLPKRAYVLGVVLDVFGFPSALEADQNDRSCLNKDLAMGELIFRTRKELLRLCAAN